MFLIFLFIAIYIVLIYLIFKLLTATSSYFFLVDEYFMSQIQDSTDKLVISFKNQSTNKNNKSTNKNNQTEDNNKPTDNKKSILNTYLRYDFFITLILGIVWFIFPKILFNFTSQELSQLPRDFKYLGQSLAIITLLSCIIPVKTIKKSEKEKKIVLSAKLFCAIVILLIQLIYLYYIPRFTIYHLILVVLLSVWSANSLSGLLNQKLEREKDEFE